jgi:hypothetical protein
MVVAIPLKCDFGSYLEKWWKEVHLLSSDNNNAVVNR